MSRNRHSIFKLKHSQDDVILFSRASLGELDEIFGKASVLLKEALSALKKSELGKIEDEINEQIEKNKREDRYDIQTEDSKQTLERQYDKIRNSHRWHYREQLEARQVKVNLTIHCKEKYYPNFTSLKEALVSRELTESVTSIDYQILSGDVYRDPKVSLHLNAKSYSSISVEGSPETNNEVETIFSWLKAWADDQTPRLWRKIWQDFGLLIGSLLAISLPSIVFFSHRKNKVSSDLGLKVKSILESGVTTENLNSAVEALLRLAAGERLTTEVSESSGSSAVPWLIVGWVLCFILWCRPTTGIFPFGNGENKIKRWNLWIRLVSISVPTFVFLKLADYVWSYFF